MDAIRHHHRSHNHLPTRYTPTLYYTWYMSVAQLPSQDMVTLYTRHTTVVQPTSDLPTFCTRYATCQTKYLHQNQNPHPAPDISTFNTSAVHQHSTRDVPLQFNLLANNTFNCISTPDTTLIGQKLCYFTYTPKYGLTNVCIYLCLSEKDSFSSSAGKRELKVVNLAQIQKCDILARPAKCQTFIPLLFLNITSRPAISTR